MQKMNFDHGWFFRRIMSRFERNPSDGEPVILPHDAQIFEPRNADYETGSGGAYFRNGTYYYTKRFQADPDWKNKKIILELEGVYQWANVTLNGDLIAKHPYGYTSFLVDFTNRLRFDRENVLVVEANNSAVPNTRWYSGAGIYRHAWLRIGGTVSLIPWGIKITTPKVDPAGSTVDVSAELVNIGQSVFETSVRFTVLDKNRIEVAKTKISANIDVNSPGKISSSMEIAPALLWSPETPDLYTLKTEVTVDGLETDCEETVFGIRQVEVDIVKGFCLNGVSMKIKGGCVHHDNGILGSASFDRAEERKVELLKAAGYTMIRCAHNPPSPSMLDACDRLGMMVMDETFDCWRMGKTPNDYHLFFENWWDLDTKAMVERDFNHPSITVWSIGNEIGERGGESDGYMWSKKQVDLVKSLDTTRPVTSALCPLFDPENGDEMNDFANPTQKVDETKDRWGDKTKGYIEPLDIVGYNYLIYRYEFDKRKYPDRIIAGTETFPSQQFEYWMETLKNDNIIGDFVWTAIDYLGEAGIGISEYEQKDPHSRAVYPWNQAWCGDFDVCGFKRPQSYFRDILWGIRTTPYIAAHDPDNFGKKPTISPWGWNPVRECWNYPGKEGKELTVEVYSDADEVELIINEKTQGKKPAGKENRNTAVFDVVYEPGTITAIAYRNGMECGSFSLFTSDVPAKVQIIADRDTICKNYGDLSYLTTEILDAKGQLVACADNSVTYTVEGAGALQAVGNNNPKSEENYFGNTRKAHDGKLMAVVKSIGEEGTIRIKAESPGLESAEITVKVK